MTPYVPFVGTAQFYCIQSVSLNLGTAQFNSIQSVSLNLRFV